MDVIEIDNLSKRYGRYRALDRLTLSVPQGSIFGFLGPNGAGKTTALRILVGLLRASDGEARLFGLNTWKHATEISKRVGYLPGDVRFPQHMKGGAFLRFCNEIRGGGARPEIERLRDRFELDLRRRIRNYSRGMKQKLGLIYALMYRPDVVILDEPTTALDPLVQQTLYEELRAVVAEGRTVLFSSHTLGEVETLCDRVAIVRAGRIIENSTIRDLKARAVRHVEFRLKQGRSLGDQRPPEGLGPLVWHNERASGTWQGDAEALLRWLVDIGVADVSMGPPDLEELFSTYYRDE